MANSTDQSIPAPDHPPELQLCLRCCELRGPSDERRRWANLVPPDDAWVNLCVCDRTEFDGDVPRSGDLTNRARLCSACLFNVATGDSRWSLLYCRTCAPLVVDLRNRLGAIVPYGFHSIMNGTSVDLGTTPITETGLTGFADQLGADLASIDRLSEIVSLRVRSSAISFGLEGEVIALTDWIELHRHKRLGHLGAFVEFLMALGIERNDAALLAVELGDVAVINWPPTYRTPPKQEQPHEVTS